MKATRESYGEALAKLGKSYPNVVALDAETKNSTYSQYFKEQFPDRFYDCFIAEQNMIGMAVGMARMGKIPFVSSFAAFLSRAYDQIRMVGLGESNLKIVESHADISIGEDGFSQMALEDIATMRAIWNSVVLYPSDDVSTEKLVEQMILHKGLCYLRTTRAKTPTLYTQNEQFPIGGFKMHKPNRNATKKVTVISAGITLHEALKAQKELEGAVAVTVIDLYSIKPLDTAKLKQAITTDHIITVEDHWSEGGIGDVVVNAFAGENKKIQKLAVTILPHSASPDETMQNTSISREHLIASIKLI